VPLLFSPVNQEEINSPYSPRPRGAFLMVQLGGRPAPTEEAMIHVVREVLADLSFTALTASDVRRTTDFLHKIIDLIRGCGFCVAVFSDRTPARTLANIFFEIGVAAMLGKPVQLVWAGRNPRSTAAPSDFIRTEWIRYVPGQDDRLRNEVRDAIAQIEQGAAFYRQIGDIALNAREPDLELAFERFKQAVLIADDVGARSRIKAVRDRLAAAGPVLDGDMASHRARLLRTIDEFIGLLPKPVSSYSVRS
jgi:hypothetical protein